MPALTTSPIKRRIYGGSQGKQLLLDSINFLFAIKGKEFQKLNPSFITPDATKFIAYSHIVNRNVVGNKFHETNKALDQFLKFICGPSVQNPPLMRCIYIAVISLGAFSITEYILMGADEVSNGYISAFEWFSSNVLTCIQSSRETIVGTIGRFMDTSYFSQLPTLIKNFASTDDVSAVAIGSYVISELHSTTDVRIYDSIVQMPYASILYKKGYEDTCKEFIADKLHIHFDLK